MQGGRLVSERKMVSDIYMFDLESFRWEKIAQSSEDDIPQARYFHSADTCTFLSRRVSVPGALPELTPREYISRAESSYYIRRHGY